MVDVSALINSGASPPNGSAYTANTTETTTPAYFTNYWKSVLANQAAAAATPYSPYQGPRVAGFNPTQTAGFDATKAAAGSYQPGLDAAGNATGAAMAAPGASSAAQPWLSAAGHSSVDGIGQYMNPYTDQVVNRIGELGTRNLTENIMPGITSKFINAGQLGYGPHTGPGAAPSGMMTDTARAVRDTSADILGQQTAALQQGYTQATNLSAQDLARRYQIGSTMGNLADTQQRTQLAGAGQMADIAGLNQKYGLTGAQAVTGVGNQQQTNTQQNLDTAYADFLRQQGWPQEQIDKMAATATAARPSMPTSASQVGLVPVGQYQPSTASTIAGGLTGGAALLEQLQKLGIFG